MGWDGVERRREQRYCEGHLTLCEDVAVIKTTVVALDKRINGTIGAVEKHIENSRPRNIAILGVSATIFVLLFNTAVSLGEAKKQIEVNTKIIDKIEIKK